jgi:MFS family permease
MVSFGRRHLSETGAFWAYAATYAMFMFAAAAPTPLYGVYAQRFGFSPLTLTVIFAVYAIVLLGALLVVGRLSDHLGRKPVILASVAVEIVAMLAFISASSTATLLIGRVLQGVATGAALGALSAGIIEFGSAVSAGTAPMVTSSSPSFGLAAGAVVAGALVQYAPAPLTLVYWVMTAAFIAAGLFVATAPEPGTHRPGALASLKPVATVPAHVRPAFLSAAPTTIAGWALNGFNLSLLPTLVSQLTHTTNHLWGGFAVFTLTFVAGAAAVLFRSVGVRKVMAISAAGLLAGSLLFAAAIATSDVPLFFAGALIAGFGFGLSLLGGIRSISGAAHTHERGGVLAAFYILTYLAFSVPVVAAGIAESTASGHDVAFIYILAIAVLAAVGLIISAVRATAIRSAPSTKH